MAKFTASVDLNLKLRSGEEAIGAAGTTHRISDAYVTEFIRDIVPVIPGGVTWITQDEESAIGGASAIILHEIDGSPSTTVTDIAVTNALLTVSGSSATLGPLVSGKNGGREVISSVISAGSAQTVDLANGNVFDLALNAATCTITLTGATTGLACHVVIITTQDSVGGRTLAWPAGVSWSGGITPNPKTSALAEVIYVLTTLDGGTTWTGRLGESIANPMTGIGDIIYATDSNGTPGRLGPGASGTILTSNGTAAPPSYQSPAGEIDYVAKTTGTSITATAESSANTIVTGSAFSYDGATIVMIEFFCDAVAPSDAGSNAMSIYFYEDSTSLGRMAYLYGSAANEYSPVFASFRRTPSAGLHTYSVRAAVSAGTGTVSGAPGGSGSSAPAYIRIARA